MVLGRSSYVTRAQEFIEQPVQFSHAHHVGDDGIDCRYCHTSVETSQLRRHPADQDLHELPLADLGQRADARTGARQLSRGQSLRWIRVHDLPDFVYFNHSIHVKKGVGCRPVMARSTRCR